MMEAALDHGELMTQKALLFSAIGEPSSGYARYSAAMYFHQAGLLSLEMLEIYRRCCKFDHEDPIALAQHEGIAFKTEHDFELEKASAA